MINSSPLRDRSGSFIGALVVIRDVTAVAQLEQGLGERASYRRIVGNSPRMEELFQHIDSLADQDTTVLITGESGTGKELVAEALHYGGRRSLSPFVKVNCSALVENLLESELFGHAKGAFTGAARSHSGRFQKAHGGTIFLDEIGDISPRIQLKLRFLEYPWPGNIRELEHALERACLLCRGEEITLKDLPLEIREYRGGGAIPAGDPNDRQPLLLVLTQTDWNMTKAARLLGVSRPTLYRKIAAAGLTRPI